MKKLIQSREELWLVIAGFGLPLLLFVLYIWGVSSIGSRLDKATDATISESIPPVEFNLKEAEDVLRARGLLQ